jgi:DNA-binding response OmpR family regulator
MNVGRPLHVGESAGPQAECGTNPPHRILVVDDDISIRELSTMVLSTSGYQVDTAEDGVAGWNALHARSYALLITDNRMPKVSGIELVKRMRSAGMPLPVILASGAMPDAELNRHPWLQLAATLLKPFSGDELLGTVQKVLHAADGRGEQIEPMPLGRSQRSADASWV